MSLPAETTLIAAIETALGGIIKAAGYRTDIGYTVLVDDNRRATDEECPCCILAPGNDSPGPLAGPNGHVTISFAVGGYLNRTKATEDFYTADQSAEFALIEAIIRDIRDALEGTGCALSSVSSTVQYIGSARYYHQEGGSTCGATVNYEITTPHVDFIPGQ